MSQTYRKPSPHELIALSWVTKQTGYSLEQLRCRGRSAGKCAARAKCYEYLMRQGWSLPEIGWYFARDHTSILWATTKKREQKLARLRDYYANKTAKSRRAA